MSISVPFTGGCACGVIRYECSAAPLFIGNCHCRDCQQFSGSAYTSNVSVPAVAFTFTQGEPRYYAVTGEMGKTLYRGFCSACGSPVGGRVAELPDMRWVTAASLDDPSGLEPQADTWTSSAQPWDTMNPALPKYEHTPTDEQMQELMAARP